MNRAERLQLLAELDRGAISRNRSFQRFQDPAAHRVLRAHRRLLGLRAELRQPDVRVTARWSWDGRTVTVECQRPQLRYSRRLILTEWETAFLLQTPAGARLAAPSAVPF